MRITDILNDDDIRSLASGKNSQTRSVLYIAIDKMIELESAKILKAPGISDSDFDKDIRTQIGKVKGIKLIKRLLEEADKNYGR